MLRLIQDSEKPESKENFLWLYKSLGETYNDLNQELLNGFLKFDLNNASSFVAPMAHLSSFNSDTCPSLELDLETRASYSSLKHHLVSPRGKTSSESAQSLKLKGDFEKNQSAFLLADIFRDELETALGELEARNREVECEKRQVLELESKLSDSSCKIESLESELEQCNELLEVSEAEVSKLMEMWSEWKAEKAKLQKDNAAELLDSLRAELRSRDVQIEQMEEYLNQVSFKDTGIVSESGTDKNVMEELETRVEELENQVEMQRNVISEREEEKRKAIRELCFSLDHYKSRYIQLVRSLSGKNKVCLVT
ncbi:protein NETWORKED 4B [Eutrema salsugineum]|nr:protein NETWORKED 4B [Eutrema salsugineum]